MKTKLGKIKDFLTNYKAYRYLAYGTAYVGIHVMFFKDAFHGCADGVKEAYGQLQAEYQSLKLTRAWIEGNFKNRKWKNGKVD